MAVSDPSAQTITNIYPQIFTLSHHLSELLTRVRIAKRDAIFVKMQKMRIRGAFLFAVLRGFYVSRKCARRDIYIYIYML